jgi:hypothetical protein
MLHCVRTTGRQGVCDPIDEGTRTIMAGAHRQPSTTARTLRRAALSGVTLAAGGVAAFGMTGAAAGAATQGSGSSSDTASTAGDSSTGTSSSLVDVSHNQVPVQVCHDQVPVNVLGVQVPVQDATGALGITGLGSGSTTDASSDASCQLAAAQGPAGESGGNPTPPSHGGSTTPPSSGGSTTPPSSGGSGGHGKHHHHGGPSSTPVSNTTSPSPASPGAGQIHQVPHGSVNAGGGGTAGGGVDPWQLGLGGAAVLAGAGLATTAGLRGRRQ